MTTNYLRQVQIRVSLSTFVSSDIVSNITSAPKKVHIFSRQPILIKKENLTECETSNGSRIADTKEVFYQFQMTLLCVSELY